MGGNGRKERLGEKIDPILTWEDRMREKQAITIFGYTLRAFCTIFFSHNFAFTHFTSPLFLLFRDIVFHFFFL